MSIIQNKPQNQQNRPNRRINSSNTNKRKYNTTIFLVIASIALVLFAINFFGHNDTNSEQRKAQLSIKQSATTLPNTPGYSTAFDIAKSHTTSNITKPVKIEPIKHETICQAVQPGDTITAILGHYFTPAEILTIAAQSKSVFPLSSLCAGHPYQIEIANENFVSFYYDINKDEQLVIEQQDNQFDIYRQAIPYTVEVEVIGGLIQSSLFSTIAKIGESSKLVMKIMDIFAWDVDFIRDIRQNDYFIAIVEKRYRDGNLAGYGNLLAAQFSNRQQVYFAFRFNDGDGQDNYFDENGKSLRKAFLKAPLKYTRISSGYTKRRFHPVLNKWKPHLAIDYAAPTGTPVRAVANGTIIQKSRDKYNGNKIRLRHPNSYETTYIHLSKFARGMKKGRHVKQGEVIAYVGMTGIATGPHLDFRVFKNGHAINPLKMKSTPAKPISKANKAAFAALVAQLQQQLLPMQQQLQQQIVNQSTSQQ